MKSIRNALNAAAETLSVKTPSSSSSSSSPHDLRGKVVSVGAMRIKCGDAIADGGMATVYLGRAVGVGGFERKVAIKVMHDHIADDPDFVAMFLDEARLAARIHHPNVVGTMDVQKTDDVMFLVM